MRPTRAIPFLALLVACSSSNGSGGADGGTSRDAAAHADADPLAPDADPTAPDADPAAPDASPWQPDAAPGCDDGLARCGADCFDLDSSDLHCGDCDNPCDSGETCLIGNCVAGVGALVLSELHAQEPAYVELYNGGTTPIELADHQIQWNTDNLDSGAVVLPSYSLAAGDFVVLREGSGTSGGGVIYLGDTVSWRNHIAVRLLAPGGLGLDFVRTGASAVAPPIGTSWTGANALNPGASVDQSLVRNVYAADTDSNADWSLTSPASPGAYCGRPGRCGDRCVDFSADRDNCGGCGVTCGGTQLCIDGGCRTGLGGPWLSEYRRYPRPGVEVHNPSTSPVDLAGYRIDLSGSINLSYTFPGYTLAAGGYLFVYMGAGDPDPTSLFAGPSAAFAGDVAIALYDDGSNALDFVRFGGSAAAAPAGTFWFGGNVPAPPMGLDQAARRNVEVFDSDSSADWVLQSPSTPGTGCLDGLSICGGACTDLEVDPAHCGDCATTCGDHQTCRAGSCRSAAAVVLTELRNYGAEGFEVANLTAAPVDLQGWQIEWVADGGGDSYTIGAITLAPGERRWFDEGSATSGTTVGMSKAINWSTHIAVALKDAGGDGVDFVRTGSSVTTPPSGTGWSGGNAANPSNASSTEALHRDEWDADSDGAADWSLATPSPGRACPGAAESVCGGGCADLLSSPASCGACGNSCGHGELCYQGACLENGTVRLSTTGGNGVSTGRAEVFWNSGWYTLYSPDASDATVICRQLGFSTGAASSSNYGTCSGCGYLYSIACTGDEARFADCPFSWTSSTGYGWAISCSP